MKKIAIAAALAVTSLVASAQVTVSGKISQWVDSTSTGGDKVTAMPLEPTSNIGLTAREDLGNGLSARAVVETSLRGNTVDGSNNTQLGDRQATVGLANRLGSIDLGRNVHSQFVAISSNDPFNTLYGSIAGDVHNLRGLRFSNGTFVSISPIPGMTATYDRSNNAPGQADQTAASVSGQLSIINATAAVYESGAEKSTVVGANTKFGNTTVSYVHSDNQSLVAGETKKGDLVGVAHKMGAYTAKASYGRTNTEVKAYNFGVDYALSKRTEVGVAYRNVNLANSSQDIKQIGAGLTLRF
jgi:predicted porin